MYAGMGVGSMCVSPRNVLKGWCQFVQHFRIVSVLEHQLISQLRLTLKTAYYLKSSQTTQLVFASFSRLESF